MTDIIQSEIIGASPAESEFLAPKIPSAPISLFISITSRCNMACRHCAVYSPEIHYGQDLSTEQWLSFFKEIERLQLFKVKISGGEPFVREDIFTLLDALYALPIRLSINTNATLIDKDAARRLAWYRDRLDDIMVSLDGSCPRTYDALRGSGTFERAVPGIESLAEHVGKVTAYCTVTRLNMDELPRIFELSRDLGITSIKFNELLPEGRAVANGADLHLHRSERSAVIDRLKEIKEVGGGVAGTFFEVDDIFDSVRCLEGHGAADDALPSFLSGCGALVRECAVRPDGWATPCDRLPALTAGHILETPLDVIWRESETFAFFRSRFITPLLSLPQCADCPYTAGCTGGCPAGAYAAHGTIMAPDPACCYRLHTQGNI
ncbi:MAG: radical SAM protein [Deltaproteobacteria bacterium]|nr:radical SAM protein [Candidatus Zymogenaceae bacterium]